ncbi:hypothetical protein D3C80_833570 [compost metagenome]
MVTDRIMAPTQAQLVSKPQRAVPVQANVPLLLARTALAVVVTREVGTPRFLGGVFDDHITAANGLARGQFHARLVGRQAVELIDHLLDFSQIDHLALPAGESHGQFTIGQAAGGIAAQFLQLAFDDQHLKVAGGQILLRQVGAGGHQPFLDVMVGDRLEQLVKLGHTQALALKRLDQRVALCSR